MRPVSAKWPRKLVPNCSSNPSWVSWRVGGVITAALLIKMSTGRPSPRSLSLSALTDSRDARSRSVVVTVARGAAARMRSTAAAPLRGLRTGSTRSAPAEASLVAICSPSPSLAPVTTASFPAWPGSS